MPEALVSYAFQKKPIGIKLDNSEWFIQEYANKHLQDYVVENKLTWGGYDQLGSAFGIHPYQYQNYHPDFQYALFFPNQKYIAIDIDVPDKSVDILPLLIKTGINPDTNLIERSQNGGYHIYAENVWKLNKDINLNDQESKNDLATLFGMHKESVSVFGEYIDSYKEMERLYGKNCKWGFEIKTKSIIAYNKFLSKRPQVNIASSTNSSKALIEAIKEIHKKNKKESDPIRFYDALKYPMSSYDLKSYLDEKGIWWRDKNGYMLVQCPFHNDTKPSASFHEWNDMLWFKCFTEDLTYTIVEFITEVEGSEASAKAYLEKFKK